MIRDNLKSFKGLDHDPDFRWRGTNVTRIENLSDIVFAIALGMLITGVDAPKNVEGLRIFLISAIPTAAGFAVLLGLWHDHYTFFRRYGVADKKIVTLNAMLIFVVLFMAYPMRFAFDSLFAWLTMVSTGDFTRTRELGVLSFKTAGELVGYFSLAYAFAFALFGAMQGHVLKKAELLSLSSFEIAVTKQMRFIRWAQCFIAITTCLLAFLSPINAVAGAVLGLFSVAYWLAKRCYPSKHLMESHADT